MYKIKQIILLMDRTKIVITYINYYTIGTILWINECYDADSYPKLPDQCMLFFSIRHYKQLLSVSNS